MKTRTSTAGSAGFKRKWGYEFPVSSILLPYAFPIASICIAYALPVASIYCYRSGSVADIPQGKKTALTELVYFRRGKRKYLHPPRCDPV